MEKSLLRKIILSTLSSFGGKEEESERILSILLSLPAYKEADTILAFSPLSTEPDISPILNDKRVLLPFITGEGEMEFGRGKLEKNKLGFFEPKEKKAVGYNKAIILVPLVALDGTLTRLGRGKGFYDRYLERNKDRLFSIALAYSPSLVPSLPHNKWDQRVDMAIVGNGEIISP